MRLQMGNQMARLEAVAGQKVLSFRNVLPPTRLGSR
jgi:hypothetical protein